MGGAWNVVEIDNFVLPDIDVMQLAVAPTGDVYSIIPADNNGNTGLVNRWDGVVNDNLPYEQDQYKVATGEMAIDATSTRTSSRSFQWPVHPPAV